MASLLIEDKSEFRISREVIADEMALSAIDVNVQFINKSLVRRDFSGNDRECILSKLVLSKVTEFTEIPVIF